MIRFLNMFYQGLTGQQLTNGMMDIFEKWSADFDPDPPAQPELAKEYLACKTDDEKRATVKKVMTALNANTNQLYRTIQQYKNRHWIDTLVLPYEQWIKYEQAYLLAMFDSSKMIHAYSDLVMERFYEDLGKLEGNDTDAPIIQDRSGQVH